MTKEVLDYEPPTLDPAPPPSSAAQFELSALKWLTMSARGPSWLIAFIVFLLAATYIISKRF